MNQKWPKILTKPKNPFTSIRIENTEEKKQRIQNLKPNKKFHDFHTIQWFRRRFSEHLIKKSVFSLLPDNGKPVVPDDESEEDRNHRLLKEWLVEYCQPKDRFEHLNINPKYLFNEQTFEKVLKLKEIFLQFDEDGSRAMEINEMEEMFNKNNIPATTDELVSLFFKDKVKKENFKSLFLDFYQFMEFALTKDQDFRLFMRKIKEKKNQKESLDESKEQKNFLPMNFNLVLDYFTDKGKERESIKKIKGAVREMEKIVNPKGQQDDSNENNDDEDKNDKDSKDSKDDNKDPYERQLKKINFEQLIQEFSNLFHIKDAHGSSGDASSSVTIRRGTVNRTPKLQNFSRKVIHQNSAEGKRDTKYSILKTDYANKENENNKNKGVNYFFIDMLDNQFAREDIMKMNHDNYNKFHSIKVALKETKRNIERKKNGIDPLSGKSTMYATNFLPQIIKRNTLNNIDNKKEINNFNHTISTKFENSTFRGEKKFKVKHKDFIPFELLKDINK